MNKAKLFLLFLILLLQQSSLWAQSADTVRRVTVFSGSLGFTNNGFSIVPSFSLNSPATVTLLSWRRKAFSIDPDIRMTPDLKKGSMLLWFRFYPVEKPGFSLRLGAHPAVNIQRREITENGTTTTISQLRRYLAWEAAPSFRIANHLRLGSYYLFGKGLQKDGARTTHFLTLNAAITNLRVGGPLLLSLFPAVYYLKVNGDDGNYFTATASLRNPSWPFALESIINKTFRSSLPGNKEFMWNVTFKYLFSKKLEQKK